MKPWTISIAAGLLAFYSTRDGLILAYALSVAAGLVASIIPLVRSYGWTGWKPHPMQAWEVARENMPLAAADSSEWGLRRLDVAILGWFASPASVGIYAFLLLAEVMAATAAVSEAALVYVARHRNLMISLLMIGTQATLSITILSLLERLNVAEAEQLLVQAATAAACLAAALGLSSVPKARLLTRLLGHSVQGWRGRC